MTREALAARLELELGLDRQVLGEAALERLVRAGMRRSGVTEESAYLEGAMADAGAWRELVEDVVVPETWFFRDRGPFELIRAMGAEWAAGSGAPFRALSLPCSTGEEAYSIALALAEGGLAPARFSILAVDLSERSLASARGGVYRDRAMRLVPPETRQRYFQESPSGSRIRDDLRASVRFAAGNALDPGLLARQEPFDLILCRNLLIYLTAEARARLIGALADALAVDGCLIVGHAEGSRLLDQRFRPVEQRGTFAYRKQPDPVRPGSKRGGGKRPVGVTSPAARVGVGGSGDRAGRSPRARSRTVGDGHVGNAPHAIGGDAHVGNVPHDPGASAVEPDLAEVRRLADSGDFERASELCGRWMLRHGPSAPAYHLLGSIAQARGDLERAEEHHRRAVYLDPGLADSLLALSLLARRRGDRAGAERLARRASRADGGANG